MNFVNETIDQLDLRKWVKTSEEKNEENDGWNRLLWRFECENEYWKWNIDFINSADCLPGILGINNLVSKKEQRIFEGYIGDLFVQNTSLGVRNNIINLLNCSSVEQFFDIYFSKYEKLEKLLAKHFIVKVPYPLREMFFCLNDHFRSEGKVYRIELFSLENIEDMKELCILIPLADEYDEAELLDKGTYYIYMYPSKNKINMRREKLGRVYYLTDWDANERNLLYAWDRVPIVINKYDDSALWSKKTHKLFSQQEKKIVLTLLSVQKYYLKQIDKNIFLKIIEEIFNNDSVCLPSLLTDIYVISNKTI